MRVYDKEPKTLDQLCDHLTEKGLVINDQQQFQAFLKQIGYYRLSAYFIPFYENSEGEPKRFKAGVTDQNIIDLYEFDRGLRHLFIEALEHIEIAVRASINQHLCMADGNAHWFFNSQYFNNNVTQSDLIQKIMQDTRYNRDPERNRRRQNNRSEAVNHYYQSYNHPPLPPSWVVLEELTLGSLSRIFKDQLEKPYRILVSQDFNVPNEIFMNWLQCLSNLRNKCAHHSRVWNAQHTKLRRYDGPKKGRGQERESKVDLGPDRKTKGYIEIIDYILRQLDPNSDWKQRVMDHVVTCPLDYHRPMGFSEVLEQPEQQLKAG